MVAYAAGSSSFFYTFLSLVWEWPMTDNTTPVAELKQLVRQFVADRGWEKHHQPKHLAGSILIEVRP